MYTYLHIYLPLLVALANLQDIEIRHEFFILLAYLPCLLTVGPDEKAFEMHIFSTVLC